MGKGSCDRCATVVRNADGVCCYRKDRKKGWSGLEGPAGATTSSPVPAWNGPVGAAGGNLHVHYMGDAAVGSIPTPDTPPDVTPRIVGARSATGH